MKTRSPSSRRARAGPWAAAHGYSPVSHHSGGATRLLLQRKDNVRDAATGSARSPPRWRSTPSDRNGVRSTQLLR